MDSLNGILFKDWVSLLKTNHFNISGKALPTVLGLTYLSVFNSLAYKKEKQYEPEILKTALVQDPVFVVGHWRSGTTFLHKLLCQNERYGFANIFEIRNPHTFIARQNLFELRKKQHKPQTRPTDNVLIDFTSPAEEEFGVAIVSKMSPLFGWVFPENETYYEKFSTFRTASAEQREQWKNSFHFFMQKLTFLHKKPLLLKSPLNTGRIKMLLELYPKAKFIHIHRNPYTVFQSTVKMYKTALARSAFQKRDLRMITQLVLERYTEIYDAFFSQKEAIPAGNFVDISFEELEHNPLAMVKSIYSELQLEGYSAIEQKTMAYVDTLKGYIKNKHLDLENGIKERIFREWERSFTEWKYSE